MTTPTTPAAKPKLALPSLTTGEAAAVLHLSARTVVKFCADGRLPTWKVPESRDRRIPWRGLIDFADANRLPVARTVLGVNLTGLLDLEALQKECQRRLLYLDVAADVFDAGVHCNDQHAAALVIPRPGWERSLVALGVKFEGRVIEAQSGADVVPLAEKLVEMVARRAA